VSVSIKVFSFLDLVREPREDSLPALSTGYLLTSLRSRKIIVRINHLQALVNISGCVLYSNVLKQSVQAIRRRLKWLLSLRRAFSFSMGLLVTRCLVSAGKFLVGTVVESVPVVTTDNSAVFVVV